MSTKALVTGSSSKKGEFLRATSTARNKLDSEEYPWEENRYCLYVADACGWAYRVHCVLHLLNLEPYFKTTVVHPTWNRTRENDDKDQHHGWCFANKDEVILPPALKAPEREDAAAAYKKVSRRNNHVDIHSGLNPRFLRDLYEIGGSTANVYSTPMIFDPITKKVVNNESSDICEILDSLAKKYYGKEKELPNLFPAEHKDEIEALNAWIYPMINNGVYRCGFAKTQEAYDIASKDLITGMHRLEALLKEKHEKGENFLIGNSLTIADIRAFSHLIRMDDVYVVYFKAPFASLLQFPNVFAYTARLLAIPEIEKVTNMEDIRLHYFTSHAILNPLAIVPASSGVVEMLRDFKKA